VGDDEAFFGVGVGAEGIEDAAAVGCTVAGVDIHVEGAEAVGAVVAGGVAQGRYLFAAVCTDESVVVFRESFGFHYFLLAGEVWRDGTCSAILKSTKILVIGSFFLFRV